MKNTHKRLMFCVAIRWQACNSELISHESGAGMRGFKKQHFIIIYLFYFLVERDLSNSDSLVSASVGFFDKQSGQNFLCTTPPFFSLFYGIRISGRRCYL